MPAVSPVTRVWNAHAGVGSLRSASTEIAMSVSGGTKRRRRRDRAFLQFYEMFSRHAAIAAVTGTIAFLAWVAVRSLVAT